MSESEGIHGNAAINSQTNGLQRLPPPARRLRPHHRTNSLSASRPSVAPADLCLAGLRPVSAVSGAQPVSGVLARKARGTVVLGDRRALAPDQARGAARHRRRISFALTSVADARPALSQHAHDRPIRHVASVPERIDLRPSESTSSRRSGAMVERPAIIIPSEPKLAKP